MFLDIISLIGTIVTIGSAIVSLIAWANTKKYYNKIILIEDIEKIDIALADIKKAKEEYNQILSIFGCNRGAEGADSIRKKFKKLKQHLQHIENELPQSFQEIHILCTEPIQYIDSVIGGTIECQNSQEFVRLQSNINRIQQTLKIKRDELRW